MRVDGKFSLLVERLEDAVVEDVGCGPALLSFLTIAIGKDGS